MVGSEVVGSVNVHSSRFGAHGNQVIELVAAIDIHPLRDRSYLVGGIEIAVACDGVVASPLEYSFRIDLNVADVVLVSRFGVEHLTENSLANHVKDGEDVSEIATVLEHYAMA